MWFATPTVSHCHMHSCMVTLAGLNKAEHTQLLSALQEPR